MKAELRKAKIGEIRKIQNLINQFAKKDLMLPRSLNELYETLRDFWVYIEKDRLLGCCALHICWNDLVEIKSLAVQKRNQNQGIGTKLVEVCIEEAKELGAKRIFVLTYKPKFFKRLGFRRIETDELPHKIWAECINCPKFPDCKEVAMLKVIK